MGPCGANTIRPDFWKDYRCPPLAAPIKKILVGDPLEDLRPLGRDAVNRQGGAVTLVHLPGTGIHGNSHLLFSDLNNVRPCDFLEQKNLDR